MAEPCPREVSYDDEDEDVEEDEEGDEESEDEDDEDEEEVWQVCRYGAGQS